VEAGFALGQEPSHPCALAVLGSRIGDALFSLAALAALKECRPRGGVVLLCPASLADLGRCALGPDAVWARPKGRLVPPLSWVRRARRNRFREALVFSPSRRAVLLGAASGARVRVGFASGHFPWLLTHRIAVPTVFSPQIALNIVRTVEPGAQPRTYQGLIRLSEEQRATGRRLLQQAGMDAAAPYVVVAPGCNGPRDPKLWPPERFAAVAAALAQVGWQIVVVGTSREALMGAQIRCAAKRAVDLAGRTDPVQLAAILEGAELLIGNDSGPAHLAAALGRRTVTVTGPTNPAETGPQGAGHVCICGDADCAPCYDRPTCTDRHCLLTIELDVVVRAALDALRVQRTSVQRRQAPQPAARAPARHSQTRVAPSLAENDNGSRHQHAPQPS
jgi:ADP-heptose:LPS heptosyltransferase